MGYIRFQHKQTAQLYLLERQYTADYLLKSKLTVSWSPREEKTSDDQKHSQILGKFKAKFQSKKLKQSSVNVETY